MSFRTIESALRVGIAVSAIYATGCEIGKNQTKPDAATVSPGMLRKLPLVESLKEEVVEMIRLNIVTVRRKTKAEYGYVDSSVVDCSGFITRNFVNAPFAVTALHCLPETIVSEADGQTYLTQGEDGTSIFTIFAIDENGNQYTGDSIVYYTNSEQDNSRDVSVVRMQDELKAVGLSLNLDSLNREETYYSARLVKGVLYVSPLHFLDSPVDDENRFIDLADGLPCIPGASGSAIINSVGEVVAVIGSVSSHELTAEDVSSFKLHPIHTGRIVRMCIAASASRVYNLYLD